MKIIRSMTPLRQRMIEDMQIRNLSPHTIDGYVRYVAQFAKHYNRFCQLIAAETLVRRTGALSRSSLTLKRPALYPSLPPNSRIVASSGCGTPMPTADAVAVGSVGKWVHKLIETAGRDRGI
jgi:Phage integrase, N-terminal SAM-like domain